MDLDWSSIGCWMVGFFRMLDIGSFQGFWMLVFFGLLDSSVFYGCWIDWIDWFFKERASLFPAAGFSSLDLYSRINTSKVGFVVLLNNRISTTEQCGFLLRRQCRVAKTLSINLIYKHLYIYRFV